MGKILEEYSVCVETDAVPDPCWVAVLKCSANQAIGYLASDNVRGALGFIREDEAKRGMDIKVFAYVGSRLVVHLNKLSVNTVEGGIKHYPA